MAAIVSLPSFSVESTIPSSYGVCLLSISAFYFRKAVMFALYWASFAVSYIRISFSTRLHHYFHRSKYRYRQWKFSIEKIYQQSQNYSTFLEFLP